MRANLNWEDISPCLGWFLSDISYSIQKITYLQRRICQNGEIKKQSLILHEESFKCRLKEEACIGPGSIND